MALSVLALHGFGQNATVFMEKRVKELARKLRAVVSLHAIDAPHSLPYDHSLRGWWSYSKDLWDGRGESIQALAAQLLEQDEFEALGLPASFDAVLAEWSRGGYDGILGFSQGAIMAAAVCSELHRVGSAACPRFVILISGFGKPVPCGLRAFPPKQPLPVPSLHIWGEADDHIPGWASQALASHFSEPRVYVHSGHHFVPQKPADIQVIHQFLALFAHPGTSAPETGSTSSVAKPSRSGPQPSKQQPKLKAVPPPLDELAGALLSYTAHCAVNGTAVKAALDVQHRVSGYLPEELEPPGIDTHERLLALLRGAGVGFATLGPHAACRTSEDSVQVRLAGGWHDTTLHSGAKAMLLHSQDRQWLLAVVPADCKLSWKKVRAIYGKGTRMATEDEVRNVTGCVPGAVPPFASAFPTASICLADASLPPVINFNCGLRTRSIRMSRVEYESVERPLVVELVE